MKSSALLLLLPLAACGSAIAAPNERAAAPSPEQVVAARRAAFTLTGATFGSMKPVVESGGDVKPLGFAARGLNLWAQALPGMFPNGSQLPTSRAKPALWQKRADFEAKAAAFQAATAALQKAADAGDAAAFKIAYGETGKACGGCHSAYRQEAPR
ncbi:cytochrome c [Sphingosinicella sp. BN140058]|uniref:cytochrome c n=1 Tax=Sphingosinicella sp. BN140058 TaxID=1892855 RepID=UPI0013EBB8B0|nr:cytochrome c [Sphingosinicella sp. BN140058]